ncbi:GlsB/YeaQ/YmgE family stress response membrane protein [Peribacillus sp. YIM B13472]|uniref:GlsB/YeaQ/YmgE family stress response membrane protein n=1 Tax=Bacillaceae TaxID=186817 RepID=UPI00119F0449|nr:MULTISPECIES: GlsB/YeaQ/YmgE family stress response membrane protein [Bacillaceae]MBT2618532.1 GlsB/YeaQ/YmgE family stress response membrane protein [Bacillus sp. ISL-78]MBT2632222.1 GlsB/YeaQ/YmgE family stress response membrane protein [Bacillus sp. ISL-101]MBT2717241.1 GlsB/YeaQ/YmgE family stress response membrane protein [Bacillus sp. ISL-57]
MGFIWALIIGGIIGWIASLIAGRDIPGGIIGNIIAGFIGAWLGSLILGSWGPEVGGFFIIPAIIGAIILVFIISLILRSLRKRG